MPSTAPLLSIRGPPELPPLMAVSVWIRRRPVPLSVSRRPMLPAVTVASSVLKESTAWTVMSAARG